MMIRYGVSALLILTIAGHAQAQETTTYSYDALGRLTGSSVAGGASSGTTTTVDYDPAGNRQRYKVAGSPNVQQQSNRFIVVPLNGFTVIPLPSTPF